MHLYYHMILCSFRDSLTELCLVLEYRLTDGVPQGADNLARVIGIDNGSPRDDHVGTSLTIKSKSQSRWKQKSVMK